jgi:hypothetical protein
MWIFLLLVGVGCGFLLLSEFFWKFVWRLLTLVIRELFKPPIQANWKDMDGIEHIPKIYTSKPIIKTPMRTVKLPIVKPQAQEKDFSKPAVQIDETTLNKWIKDNPELRVEAKR